MRPNLLLQKDAAPPAPAMLDPEVRPLQKYRKNTFFGVHLFFQRTMRISLCPVAILIE